MRSVSEHTRSLWQNLRSKNVYLSCSGGVDSMVLLHLLKRLKVNLTVIHVNYQLRGEDSIQDAELIQSTCIKLDIPCETRTVDLKKKLQHGGNLQDEARKVRYAWFEEIKSKNPANRIALAHHQDDQVETFLMNLSRKSGILGLACMKHEHNGVIRPLLDFSKVEILSYAINNAVEWREDKSNESNSYTRNRLRNEYIPFIKSELNNFNASVLTLVKVFQEKQAEIEQKVHPLVKSILQSCVLPISHFEALDRFEQTELLRQLGLPASYVPRMHELTERGKQLLFNDASFEAVVRDKHQFTFLKKERQLFQLHIEEIASLPKTFNKDQAYFDASKIQGELTLRVWESGDRICPIGMKGSQLISDIIKDAQITADAKRNQLVVHDDNAILWCVGLKISRNALADEDSNRIICCSITS